jgi:receptor expression-enhancing protein 5/6
LFIPFYDEFKSIVLLLLIFKRARVRKLYPYGCSRVNHTLQAAEPIYLHLIRPLLKPCASTLDASLELLLMIGDFIFALSAFPVKLGLELWEKPFGFDQFLL